MSKWKQEQKRTPGPEMFESGPAGLAIAPGQVWEGVVAQNRPINNIQAMPGVTLPAILVENQNSDGTWQASFVGESNTKLTVDLEMLKTGRLRV